MINPICTSEDLPSTIETALRSWPGDASARRRMAPPMSYGRQSGPPAVDARCGAVVMLLYHENTNHPSDEWHIPLTVRPTTIPRHGGQICLPGGLAESDETSRDTAARELAEELGVANDIRWLGHLETFYVYVSNVLVTPWIAVVDNRPAWRPDPREVESVIEMPISTLLNPNSEGLLDIHHGSIRFFAPCFLHEQHAIWGATAMMLAEFASLMKTAAGCNERFT